MMRSPILVALILASPAAAFAEELCIAEQPELGVKGRDCPLDFAFPLNDDIPYRCFKEGPDGSNQLALTQDQRRKRIDWAYQCGYIDPRFEKIFTYIFDGFTGEWKKLQRIRFPLYGTPTQAGDFNNWRPEDLAGYPSAESCVKPDDIKWLTNCH